MNKTNFKMISEISPIAVIGLRYVGIQLAIAFNQKDCLLLELPGDFIRFEQKKRHINYCEIMCYHIIANNE